MSKLSNIKFIKTDDNSTGLYCENVKDIFHSKTGAVTEAYDKFINPIKILFNNKKEIQVLDVCYGIGYNSKSLLTSFPHHKLNIDSLEFNLDYILLSPLIKDGINDINLRYFLLKEIETKLQIKKNEYLEIYDDVIIKNKEFFDDSISFFDYFNLKSPYENNLLLQNNRFLHNIYYEYISNRLTDDIKMDKYSNASINFHIGDARKSIFNCNNKYDVIFLDAFSSQKDPTLWTIDFLRQLIERINKNGIIVSYSKATPFRNALKELGLSIGKTFINNIDMGTVASFNKDYISNPLSEYDYELLSTRSGITYKDYEFNLTPAQILKNREFEQNNSTLISHTQFLKKYKN